MRGSLGKNVLVLLEPLMMYNRSTPQQLIFRYLNCVYFSENEFFGGGRGILDWETFGHIYIY